MESSKKHDWGLILAGVVLFIVGIVFFAMPTLSLVTLTLIAGIFFLLTGVFDIINYVRFRKVGASSGWMIFFAILDIILGLMFLVHPVLLADVIPWVVGVFVIAFGVFECIAAIRVRKVAKGLWGWALFAGILSVILGIMFVMFAESFSIFIAIFLFLRGIDLVVFGWSSPSVKWLA